MKSKRSAKKASAQSDAFEAMAKSRTEPAQHSQSLTSDQNDGSPQEKAEIAVTPLEYMLAVMRDPNVEPGRRDEMAKLALPYMHPKASIPDPAGQEPAAPAGDIPATELARRIAFALGMAQANRGQR